MMSEFNMADISQLTLVGFAYGRGPYYNSKYNTAYFVVQAGRDEEKVPQNCRIFSTSVIQKLLIKPC